MQVKKLTLNTKDIIGRVGKVLGTTRNRTISNELGVNPQVCTKWKTRNKIPWVELFRFSQNHETSLD
jgi:hypothetical protein